jgi:hypothetical protein
MGARLSGAASGRFAVGEGGGGATPGSWGSGGVGGGLSDLVAWTILV